MLEHRVSSRAACIFVFGSLLLQVGLARAEHPVELGVRLAYAAPSGRAWEQRPLSDIVSAAGRAQLDMNYRISDLLAGGPFIALDIGTMGPTYEAECKRAHLSCAALAVDVGFQAELRLLHGVPVQPWAGLGVGMDILLESIGSGDDSVSVSAYGPAFTLSAGVDAHLGSIVLGPYIAYQIGWYMSVDISDAYTSTMNDPEFIHKAPHQWLMVGARGHYGFDI